MLRTNLHPDEKQLVEITPSSKVIPFWLLWKGGLILAVFIFFAINNLREGIQYFESMSSLLLVLAFIAVGTFVAYLKFVKTSYVITTERLILNTGIIGSSSRSTPYKRISDIQVSQTFLEKFFNIASVIITEVGASRTSGIWGFQGLTVEEANKASELISKYMLTERNK
jgi:membrane protein YdbS with pleckstrin-like domain